MRKPKGDFWAQVGGKKPAWSSVSSTKFVFASYNLDTFFFSLRKKKKQKQKRSFFLIPNVSLTHLYLLV